MPCNNLLTKGLTDLSSLSNESPIEDVAAPNLLNAPTPVDADRPTLLRPVLAAATAAGSNPAFVTMSFIASFCPLLDARVACNNSRRVASVAALFSSTYSLPIDPVTSAIVS